MIAFWDDEEAAAAFMRDHPLGQRFAGSGFHALLDRYAPMELGPVCRTTCPERA
jgi:hypothetical protein